MQNIHTEVEHGQEIDSAVDFHEKISLLGPWKCFFLVLDVDSSLLEECLPVLDFLESSMRVLLSTLTFQQGSPIYWLLNEHGLVFGLKIGYLIIFLFPK